MTLHRYSHIAGRQLGRSAAVGIVVSALFLTACGGAGVTGKDTAARLDPKANVTINWWTGQSSDAENLLEKLAKEYTAAHPNITINTSSGASTTDQLLNKLSAGFVSNTYPDISYTFGSWATQLGESGRTQDITALTKAPSFGWDQFPASARATATVHGKVIGLPAVVDNLGLIYNKKLFDQAGLSYPTPEWSWDDFRAAAKKITDSSKGIYGTAYSVSGSEDTTWHLWPMLWQRGGAVLSGDNTRPAFNSQAGVDAVTFLSDMAIKDKSVYLDQTDAKYGPLFLSGRVGMMISGPWQLYDLNKNKVDYGIQKLPGFNGDHQTISGPDLWTLFDHKDANRAAAAREFTTWLTSAATDARWSLVEGNLPLRTSETTTTEYATFVKQFPGVDVFVANLAEAKQPRPTVPGYIEMSRYVGEAIAKAMQGAESPKQALDEAAKKSAGALAGQ
ncbi:MAG TPA: ABC transporter substrate-binding protein [Dermatophilaceae bacterium]